MKKNMKAKILSLMTCLLMILFTGCSNDVENIIVIPGYGNGSEYVEKSGSNFIMNIGDSNYGTSRMAKAMTRAVAPEQVTVNARDNVKNVTVGTNYSTNLWDQFVVNASEFKGVSIGSTEGYVYALADIECPYENQWTSTHTIENGKLTLSGVEGERFYSPVPVEFWGRHNLATNDETKTTYEEGTTDDGWQVGSVKNSTKTVAISKNIQYANSAVKLNVQLGTRRVLGWYDNKEEAVAADGTPLAAKGTLITEDNKDEFPKTNGKVTVDGQEYELYLSNNDAAHMAPGNYYHQHLGNTIAIKQNKNGAKSWHFIGQESKDDIDFDIQEIRVESSTSCEYGKDYAYTPAITTAQYSYAYEKDHVKSGEATTMTIMPTSLTSAKVILHCKITKFPENNKAFIWYINKTIDDDTLVPVTDNTEFYIVGKVSTIAGNAPTGTPYATTWNGGIFCPDVITDVTVHIDDLCVDGAAVTDPDGANDSNIIWNYDWSYGSMNGNWTIGK